MASIKDLDVGEKFSSKLEEIRTKLLSQAMGEMLNEATVEFCQAHKQYMKSVLGKTQGLNPYMHTSSKYTHIHTRAWWLCYAVGTHRVLHGVSPLHYKYIQNSSD